MIKLSYLPNPDTMAHASLMILEQKGLLKTSIFIINLLTSLMIVAYLLKFMALGPQLKELFLLSLSLLWLFGRKPLTIKLLKYKMRKNQALKNTIEIKLSKNGIVWSGKDLQKGALAWEHIRYLIETKNGFIMPCSLGRLLWLPMDAFKAPHDLEEFLVLIKHAKVKLKSCKEKAC